MDVSSRSSTPSEFSQPGFVLKDNDVLYEVEAILKENKTQFLIQWTGFDEKGKPWPNSWVNKTDVTDDLRLAWAKKKKEKQIKSAGRGGISGRGRGRGRNVSATGHKINGSGGDSSYRPTAEVSRPRRAPTRSTTRTTASTEPAMELRSRPISAVIRTASATTSRSTRSRGPAEGSKVLTSLSRAQGKQKNMCTDTTTASKASTSTSTSANASAGGSGLKRKASGGASASVSAASPLRSMEDTRLRKKRRLEKAKSTSELGRDVDRRGVAAIISNGANGRASSSNLREKEHGEDVKSKLRTSSARDYSKAGGFGRRDSFPTTFAVMKKGKASFQREAGGANANVPAPKTTEVSKPPLLTYLRKGKEKAVVYEQEEGEKAEVVQDNTGKKRKNHVREEEEEKRDTEEEEEESEEETEEEIEDSGIPPNILWTQRQIRSNAKLYSQQSASQLSSPPKYPSNSIRDRLRRVKQASTQRRVRRRPAAGDESESSGSKSPLETLSRRGRPRTKHARNANSGNESESLGEEPRWNVPKVFLTTRPVPKTNLPRRDRSVHSDAESNEEDSVAADGVPALKRLRSHAKRPIVVSSQSQSQSQSQHQSKTTKSTPLQRDPSTEPDVKSEAGSETNVLSLDGPNIARRPGQEDDDHPADDPPLDRDHSPIAEPVQPPSSLLPSNGMNQGFIVDTQDTDRRIPLSSQPARSPPKPSNDGVRPQDLHGQAPEVEGDGSKGTIIPETETQSSKDSQSQPGPQGQKRTNDSITQFSSQIPPTAHDTINTASTTRSRNENLDRSGDRRVLKPIPVLNVSTFEPLVSKLQPVTAIGQALLRADRSTAQCDTPGNVLRNDGRELSSIEFSEPGPVRTHPPTEEISCTVFSSSAGSLEASKLASSLPAPNSYPQPAVLGDVQLESIVKDMEERYVNLDGQEEAVAPTPSPEDEESVEQFDVVEMELEDFDDIDDEQAQVESSLEPNDDDDDPVEDEGGGYMESRTEDVSTRRSTTPPATDLEDLPHSRIVGSPTKKHNIQSLGSALIHISEKSAEIANLKERLGTMNTENTGLRDRLLRLEADNKWLNEHQANMGSSESLPQDGPSASEAQQTLEAEKEALMAELHLLQISKSEIQKDRDLFQTEYLKASDYTNELWQTNRQLQADADLYQRQATDGVKSVRGMFETRIEKLDFELKKTTKLLQLLIEKDHRTNDEVRKKAAMEPELRAEVQVLQGEIEDLEGDMSELQRIRDDLLVKLREQENEVAELKLAAGRSAEVIRGQKIALARCSARERQVMREINPPDDDAAGSEEGDGADNTDDHEVYICSWRSADDDTRKCGALLSDPEELLDHLFLAGHI